MWNWCQIGTGLREDMIDKRTRDVTHETTRTTVFGGEFAVGGINNSIQSSKHVSKRREKLLSHHSRIACPRVAEPDENRNDTWNQHLQIAHHNVAHCDAKDEFCDFGIGTEKFKNRCEKVANRLETVGGCVGLIG